MDAVEKQIRWEAEQGEQLRLLTDEELAEFQEVLAGKAREIVQLSELSMDETLERHTREVE
jgi:hypothetical protein